MIGHSDRPCPYPFDKRGPIFGPSRSWRIEGAAAPSLADMSRADLGLRYLTDTLDQRRERSNGTEGADIFGTPPRAPESRDTRWTGTAPVQADTFSYVPPFGGAERDQLVSYMSFSLELGVIALD